MDAQSNVLPHILLVEDSSDDYEAVMRAFKKADLRHPVRWTRSGDDALEILKKQDEQAPQPGLVLLDLNMPGMDGRDVLQVIKSDPSLKKIPVIIFTTSSNEHDVEICYQTGANAYVQKPLGMNAMVETIKGLKNFWLETAILPPAPRE